MPGSTVPQGSAGDVSQGEFLPLRYIIPASIAVLFVAILVVSVTSLTGSGSEPAANTPAATRKLPLYWTVKPGDTYERISEKTGLSVDELETFNPTTDPVTIIPGQRLKLRLRMPPPPPKRLGPKYWTVRSGQSFGSIAAATHKSIIKLQELNPDLKPGDLQPGNRVQLRK